MLARIFAALRVFVRSLLGDSSPSRLPEPTPLIPTVTERFGKPLPYPRFEIQSRLLADECVGRLRTTLGRGAVDAQSIGSDQARRTVEVRLRMTGKYRLPGVLQRQVLRGTLEPSGRGARVLLQSSPRTEQTGIGQLLSTVAIAAIVVFVFLTWFTGPSDISLLLVAAVSIPIGAVAGALAQGLLNARGHLKERRRLTRTAARLATLLDGAVTRWP